MKAAARAARASDFIESFPEGYGAPLGDNGMKISGGQRQRVAIARELYKNAKMLIFDEATSSLDTETERAIQEEMDRMRGPRYRHTHRPSAFHREEQRYDLRPQKWQDSRAGDIRLSVFLRRHVQKNGQSAGPDQEHEIECDSSSSLRATIRTSTLPLKHWLLQDMRSSSLSAESPPTTYTMNIVQQLS